MRTRCLLTIALLGTSATAAPVPKELKKQQSAEEIGQPSYRDLNNERYWIENRNVVIEALDVQPINTPNRAKPDANAKSFFWVLRRSEK